MTVVSTGSNALVSEFSGGAQGDVEYMLGIGLVKDSEGVFFRYLGEDEQPAALMLPSGKPLQKLQNVVLTGLSLYEPGDQYNTLKLNIFLESSQGTQLMVTSGLATMWSQCVIGGLMALFNGGDLTCPFTLESWKGSQGSGVYFASIKVGNSRMSDNDTFEQLKEARSDGDKERKIAIMRDAVDVLKHAVSGGSIEPVEVKEDVEVVTADF